MDVKGFLKVLSASTKKNTSVEDEIELYSTENEHINICTDPLFHLEFITSSS